MSEEINEEAPSEEVTDSNETPETDGSDQTAPPVDTLPEPSIAAISEDAPAAELTPKQCQAANVQAKNKRKYG